MSVRMTPPMRQTHLANIQVGAVLVDLGIVQVEDGGVEAASRGNLVTGIAELNDMGEIAILKLGGCKAQGIVYLEIGAS